MKPQSSKLKVLIVDDDEMLRNFYSRILNSQGYESICAADGEEAIATLEKEKDNIRLAIIDLLMPVRTGWELVQYMKKNQDLKEIPVVITTGIEHVSDEFENIKGLCEAVIYKSELDLDKFKKLIKSIIKADQK